MNGPGINYWVKPVGICCDLVRQKCAIFSEQQGMQQRKGFQLIDLIGAGRVTRTPDLRITNALLYQLSYAGT
jgi:hypothetical protein